MITRDEWDKLSPDEQWEMVDLLQLKEYVRGAKEAEDHLKRQWNSAGIKLDGKR